MANEAARLKVLDDLKIIGTRGSSNFQNLIEVAADVIGCKAAFISVLANDQQYFFNSYNVPLTAIPREDAICERTIACKNPLIVPDMCAEADPLFSRFRAHTPEMRFYAGVPLMYQPGVYIGALALLDPEPRDLQSEQVELLERLGFGVLEAFRSYGTLLQQQDSMFELYESNQRIEEKNQQVERARKNIEVAAELAHIGFWSYNLRNKEMQWSETMRKIYGLGVEDDVSLESSYSFYPDDSAEVLRNHFGGCLETNNGYDLELPITTALGAQRWVRTVGKLEKQDGKPLRIYGCAQDVTDTVRNRHHISKLATLDTLTGCANRRFLPISFLKLKQSTDFETEKLVLLLIDVDHFKFVNDTRGHDIGDAVLVRIAQILRSSVDEADIVGRMGGDEFLLVIKSNRNGDRESIVAEYLVDAVKNTPFLQQFSTPISLSIGFADVTSPNQDFAHALKEADLAVYEAKRQGRARAIRYDPSMGEQVTRRDVVLRQIDEALQQNRIIPAYQMRRCIKTGVIEGFEALARWDHPDRGLLTPGAFFEAIEDPLYGTRISQRIFETAVADAARLKEMGCEFNRFAINVTETQLVDSNFPEMIDDLCMKHGVGRGDFEIEVTEKILLTKMTDKIRATIAALFDRGIMVSFDDFGTGYASLTHLQQFKIDRIKIDMSFVRTLREDKNTRSITSAIVRMAHELGLETVAEGIEDAETEQILREMGCDYGQGFLYSQGVVFDEIVQQIRAETERQAGVA